MTGAWAEAARLLGRSLLVPAGDEELASAVGGFFSGNATPGAGCASGHELRVCRESLPETASSPLGSTASVPACIRVSDERPLDLASLWEAVSGGLVACGLLPLHAGAVARDGRAVLLLGASGVGKSTTVARLVREGWFPVAEDTAWVEAGSLLVAGCNRGQWLLPDSLALLGEDGARCELRTDGKVFLAHRGPVRPVVGRVAAVVQLVRDAGLPVGLSALSRRAALMAFLAACGTGDESLQRQALSFEVARRAVTELPAARLNLPPVGATLTPLLEGLLQVPQPAD